MNWNAYISRSCADIIIELLSTKYKNVYLKAELEMGWSELSVAKKYPNVLFILINHNKALTEWGDMQQLDDLGTFWPLWSGVTKEVPFNIKFFEGQSENSPKSTNQFSPNNPYMSMWINCFLAG